MLLTRMIAEKALEDPEVQKAIKDAFDKVLI